MSIRKKFRGKKLSELQNMLMEFPYGSELHMEILEAIKIQFNFKYKEQFILCTKGIVEQDCVIKTSEFLYFDEEMKNHFESFNLYSKDSAFYFHDRSDCESNLKHRQIVVYALPYNIDTGEMIVMRETNGNISLMGGHVDYIKGAYNLTLSDFLSRNIRKEIIEEVDNSGIIIDSLMHDPNFIVSAIDFKPCMHELTHMIALYIVPLTNKSFKKQVKEMGPKEDFHTPAVISLDKLQKCSTKNSIRVIFNYMEKTLRKTEAIAALNKTIENEGVTNE